MQKRYRVVKDGNEVILSNARDVAEYVDCHIGDIYTAFGYKKLTEIVINGYSITNMSKRRAKC